MTDALAALATWLMRVTHLDPLSLLAVLVLWCVGLTLVTLGRR